MDADKEQTAIGVKRVALKNGRPVSPERASLMGGRKEPLIKSLIRLT